MRKRLMAVLAVFVLMPLVSWSVTLHVGDEKFTPSDKAGYTYEFSSCAARASYSESRGFVLTFWGDSEVLGNISWNGPGLNVKVGFGKLVEVLGNITSSGGGLLEINGPGTLRIINGSIDPYSADVKLFGAVVEITSREGKKAISTSGSVVVELSCLSIAGYGKVMRAYGGFKFIASMISVLGRDYSSGDGIANKAAIEDGTSRSLGGYGGISIQGCVLTIVEQHHSENVGLYTRGRLSVYDSVVTIVSEGESFHAYNGSSFGNVLMLAVSRGSCSVYGNQGDDETRKAFFADGKYVFGAATAMPAIDAGYVEIDGGKLEVCAPDGGAVASSDFTMKDGSLKMVDSVDYSMVVKEMLAEAAVMGVISACSTPMEWTTVHSQILMNMILDLTAAVRDVPEGRAEAVVKTQRFCQTGGSIDQGMAQYGCAMMLTRATFLGTWYTPAFCGGSLKSDVHRYDSGVFDEKGYYDTAPTNALGQTLTHVAYEPYWVYLNGGVTPTGCRVVFNANGGRCSTTSRQVAKGAEIGTLPTATWSGYTFDGWYTSSSGGTKVTATTKVTGDVTLYAHWVSSSSGMGDVSVTSVTAQKRYPWNGLVDITVTIQGTAEDVAEADCSFAAQNGATGESIPVAHITRNGEDVGSGTTWTRKFVWDVKADVGEVRIDDVMLTVDVELPYVQLWENGPCWAKCNVGATKPEEYGYYFWWGDTVGYRRNANDDGWISVKDSTSYSFSSCPTHVKDNSQLQSEGYIDATGNLVAAHDAAAAHLGAPWRMPTETELSALINDCDTEWTSRNGVHGRLVKGRGVYASKSIFLPAAGGGNDSFLYDLGSSGDYWSSTPRSDITYYAWTLGFYSSYFLRCSSFRCTGRPVRPVRGSANPSAAIGGVTTHFSLNCREVTISFNAQGGLPTPLAIILYEGSEYAELPAVTRPGYTFLGWYTAVSGGRKILATDVVTADVTKLYARWAEISGASYTVRYYYDQELNPKKYTTQRFSVGVPQSLLRVKDIGWSMEGYRFVGWKERSHSGRYADGEEVCDLTTEDGDVVYLHACWEPIKYRTVFHKNDGSDEIFSQVHLFDSSQRLCDIKSIMGWSNGELGFVGWATRETGDVVFSNGESVVNLTSVQDGQIHLYAIWGAMHAITFKPNNTKYGSVTVKNAATTVKSGDKVGAGTGLSLTAKAKSGYVFAGWYTDSKCTKKLNPEGYDNRKASIKYAMPAKATTVYAKFVSKSSDKKALKFSSATKKLATTATSCAAGKEMAALTVKASSASLPTLSIKGLPSGMTFDPATGAVTGTPKKPGKYTATVMVKSAAGNKVSQKVKIYVTVPSGYYGTFGGYALVNTTPAYITFTSDKYGKVSGKVTYKGKGYSFKASYSSASPTESKFTPSIKIGSSTYKPAIFVTKQDVGITVSEASGVYKDTFEVALQKKPSLIKAKKALAGMVGKSYTFKKGYENAELTKSGDKLTVKFAETDAVKVSGKAKGKKVSFSTSVLYSGKASDETGDVYTAMVMLMSPTAKYYKCLTFTITVDPATKKIVTVSKAFGEIGAPD